MEIAERRRAEEELKKHRHHLEELVAERTRDLDRIRADLFATAKLSAMGRMAAGLAHQLNSPIGGTTLLVDGLIEGCGKEHAAPLKQIRSELTRMHDIVECMLTLSMLQRRGAAARKWVELSAAIGTILDLAEHDCTANAITVQRTLPAGLPTIAARPGELDQIFLNLINNAIDAMLQGGTLTVETRAAGDSIEVRIADTGEGIPTENIEKIFEPFFTTRRARNGVGLGLSIVHEIVERYSGTIRVESEPGKGTSFTVRIPTRGLSDDAPPSAG
jgi:signal transduction histidine kinase